MLRTAAHTFVRRSVSIRSVAILSLTAFLFSAMSLTFGQAPPSKPPVTDRQARTFVDQLLHNMTQEEKINQMEQAADQETTEAEKSELASHDGVGSFLTIADTAIINKLQRLAMTKSRLHIPLLFGFDVIHGFRTIYPVPLAMASSWNPALVESAQAMAAREARLSGVQWSFTPMVDIARDPRWGRIVEGAGEDPYLGEIMAAAQVRGLQGSYVGSPDHVLATMKHFAGYGAAIGGRDYDSSDISEDALRNIYLRPFHAAVKAGVATVMSAYMDLNDVPATGNEFLMQEVLRKEWGFKGFVVSDYDAVKSLAIHGFASDDADAALRAFKVGINMEMTSSTYRTNLGNAIKAGKVTTAELDAMVRPILEMKYRLGLFDNPYVDEAAAAREYNSPEQRAAARSTAQECAVLLRNEGNLLPISKTVHSIALIGPLADSQADTLGGWSLNGDPTQAITIAAGLKAKLPEAEIKVTKGVEIERLQPSIFDKQTPSPKATMKTEEERRAEFEHAINLVRNADLTLLVLGEQQIMSAERASRATLTLPGKQQELLEAAVATGKPIILILMNGRQLNITWAAEHVPAILETWYLGTEGGNAIADLLVGDAVPGGKLPVTWPRDVGQIPIYYNSNLTQNPEAADTRYWDMSSSPLFPFGYGLSYTSFAISNLSLSAPTLAPNRPLRISVDVQNTGKRKGQEVVQVYTHQRYGSASRPVRELKAFQKISLEPNEKRTIHFDLGADELKYWSPSKHIEVLEESKFDVWVGDDSTAKLHSNFEVTLSH